MRTNLCTIAILLLNMSEFAAAGELKIIMHNLPGSGFAQLNADRVNTPEEDRLGRDRTNEVVIVQVFRTLDDTIEQNGDPLRNLTQTVRNGEYILNLTERVSVNIEFSRSRVGGATSANRTNQLRGVVILPGKSSEIHIVVPLPPSDTCRPCPPCCTYTSWQSARTGPYCRHFFSYTSSCYTRPSYMRTRCWDD